MDKNYWIKRTEKIESDKEKRSDELQAELRANYRLAREETKNKIDALIGKYATESNLTYNEVSKKLRESEKIDFNRSMNKIRNELSQLTLFETQKRDELIARLDMLVKKKKISRLDAVLTNIETELYLNGAECEKVLKNAMEKEIKISYKATIKSFDKKGLKVILDPQIIENVLSKKWSGQNFSENVWNNTEQLATVVRREITQSFIQGVNAKEVAKRINNRFDTGYNNAIRLARTELNYTLNQSSLLAYDEAEIEEYEILATTDSRVSEICREQDGKKYNVKDMIVGVNFPPFHPNCRTTTIPVINF